MSRLQERNTALSKVFWIILAIVIGAVFGYGAHIAYGEVEYFEDVIRIPIPANTTGTEKKATMTAQTDTLLEFTIKYRFHIAGNYTDWKEQILLDGGITPPDVTLCPERFYLDDDGITCYPIAKIPSNFVPIDKPKIVTKFEEKLEYYQEYPPDTYDKMDEMRKLEQLIECQNKQGIDNTVGIQDERIIWSSEYDETATVPKTGTASPLDIAIEECRAQLEAQLLAGRGEPTKEGDYLSAQDFFGREQPRHQDKAVINPEDWLYIPTQPEQKSIHDLIDAEAEAHEIICNSDRVTMQFKRQQVPPCTDEQLGIKGDYVEWNTTGVGEGKQTWYRSGQMNTSEGGGELPVDGWNMTPESEWTEEQSKKCNWSGQYLVPSEYLRIICGK